jgi:tetratricopeptide (TPR) repeat protein
MKKFMYHLNKHGGYFELKEALKPALQRIVMQIVPGSPIFKGRAPRLDTEEGNEYVSRLFTFLTAELNKTLMRKFVPECVTQSRNSIASDISVAKNIPDKMVQIKMLAEDNEGNGDYVVAEAWHNDRIGMAEIEARGEKDGWMLLHKGKLDYADFTLTRSVGDAELLNAAAKMLREALTLKPSDKDTVALLISTLLEIGGDLEEANELMKACWAEALGENKTGAAVEQSAYAAVENGATLNVLQALLHSAAGEAALSRRSLRTAGSATESQFAGRSIIEACLDAASYFLSVNLVNLASTCLSWAGEHENEVKSMCVRLGIPTGGVTELRAKMSLLKAKHELLAKAGECDISLFTEAELRNKTLPASSAKAKLLVADALLAKGDKAKATLKYIECIDLLEDPIPYRVYVALYNLLYEKGRFEEGREIMFRAAKTWKYSSVWLNIAKTSLKLGYLEDAEDSLQESNGANTNDNCSWGLFSLLCLASGEARLGEANEALKQSLGLGLSDLTILEELGRGFVDIDQLTQAESIYSRCIEVAGESEGGTKYFDLLGKVYEHMREFEKAMGMYKEGEKRGGGGQNLSELKRRLVAEL